MPGWNWQKVKANAKQHTETELLLFKNYLFFSSRLSTKNSRRHSKKWTKNKCISFNEGILIMSMKIRPKMKGRSQRCKYLFRHTV